MMFHRPTNTRARRRRRFLLEKLEDRIVMDGAGFVHTDPEPDPGSVVGVAGIAAQDDYVEIGSTTGQLRIDVLLNDPLPSGADNLRIQSVSQTARGASVTVSDDGLRILYTPPAGGVSFDSFYYIVETEDGKLGKANVTIGKKHSGDHGSIRPPEPSRNDRHQVLEDSGEETLNVLRNDGPFSNGEIVEVTSASLGTVRIADDGKSLLYQPHPATVGVDHFEYTVLGFDGETASYSVRVEILKAYQINRDGDGTSDLFARDIDTGPHTFALLANDRILATTPLQPRIVDVEYPTHAGEMVISDDGQSVTFTPADGFLGTFQYSYTVRYGSLDHQTVEGSGNVRVQNTFLAVNNWHAVDVDSSGVELDVLANDPTLRRYSGDWKALPDVVLTLVAASSGSHGGAVSLAADGKSIHYMPAAGFVGDETFTYTVEDSNGHRDSATVTLHVAEPTGNPGGVPKFFLPGQLQQFLIDQAVARFKDDFGVTGYYYASHAWDGTYRVSDVALFTTATNADTTHSDTNTQEAGVDEADIVETDGRYLYTFSGGKLVIVDLENLSQPKLVSITELEGRFTEMYLQGDRITLLDRGSYAEGKATAVVMVIDVADRHDPAVVERTEIDGRIVDSRAVGDRVYVAVNGLEVPAIDSHALDGAETDGVSGLRVYETLDEYVARVHDSIIEASLPAYRTYGVEGDLIGSGLLTDAADIHQPIDNADSSLLSLVTFDAGDDQAGPLSSTGIFTSAASEVYMSGDAIYVLRNHGGDTAIFKFEVADDGATELVATGKVGGVLLNQFSVDEHDGRLRIATTQTIFETVDERVRQQRRFNNLFVLEQNGTQLEVVGSVENLAPTETIKSVRFVDDRAYVVTFRVIDPLFVIDLSNPAQPTVEGSLKIPGFSDYLHPVGEDYVIGIGRDANEITGRVGPPQISLFYVGDLANPTLVDQVTMEGAQWASTEASLDHHAVAYFAENQVLTIPVDWTVRIEVGGDGSHSYDYDQHSAIWAFQIDVDGAGGGSIDVNGSVEHEGQARRSVRIGDALITISDDTIKINELDDPAVAIAELYVGELPEDDSFTIDEDSGTNALDVRANDHAGPSGEPPRIVAVTQPVRGGYSWFSNLTHSSTIESFLDSGAVGTVEITDDGRSLAFTPAANFFGSVTFTYTVFDELRGEQQATVTIHVENVLDAPDAADDQFEVEPGSSGVALDVLANDEDLDQAHYSPVYSIGRPIVLVAQHDLATSAESVTTDSYVSPILYSLSPYNVGSLKITEVGPTSHGGTVEVDSSGRLLAYTPAEGFVGVETFYYTITASNGLSATATVSVYVGVEIQTTPEPATEEDPQPSEEVAPTPVAHTEPRVTPAIEQQPGPEQEAPPVAVVEAAETPSQPDTEPAVEPSAGQPAQVDGTEEAKEVSTSEVPTEAAEPAGEPPSVLEASVPAAEPEVIEASSPTVGEAPIEVATKAVASPSRAAARPAEISSPLLNVGIERTRDLVTRKVVESSARLISQQATEYRNGDSPQQRFERQRLTLAEKAEHDRDPLAVDLAFAGEDLHAHSELHAKIAGRLAALLHVKPSRRA